jgi:hypothetical protein
MATYSAYFDESTSETSPIIVVAGVLSTDAQWSLFKSEWKAALLEFGIDVFHMSQFAHSRGEFSQMDEATRQALMEKLLNIIARRAKYGFATVVHQHDFECVFTGEDRKSIGSAYKLSCTVCGIEVGEWAKKNYQIEPVSFYFDRGHKHAAEAVQSLKDVKNDPQFTEYRIGSITLEDDSVLVPLQAADIAVYELWKWLDEHFASKKRHGRFPLQEIIKVPWTIREFDKPILEQMLAHRHGAKVSRQIIHSTIQALRPGQTD